MSSDRRCNHISHNNSSVPEKNFAVCHEINHPQNRQNQLFVSLTFLTLDTHCAG